MMLPFKNIPPIIIIYSVVFSVTWINFFPPGGGISETISPQTIVTGQTPDFLKHCEAPFGSYAQLHAEPEPTNDVMVSRTVGGICLRPLGNIQGTYKFLSLLTRQVINARSFTHLPMPDDVIQEVEKMASPNVEYFEDLYNQEPTYVMDRNKDDDYLDDNF